jgi:diacylglycerol kinase family enzyme
MKLLDKEQIQMAFLVGDVTAISKFSDDPYADIDLQKNVKPLTPVKITFDKPVAIIINPNSGKKRDFRALISSRLTQSRIAFTYFESTRAFMTWELAESGIELSEYSALIAVGGDGTYHEVVNGMLHRADKKRIPVGFVPNGSGNDMLRALGVTNIAKALDYIVKGDLLKADLV